MCGRYFLDEITLNKIIKLVNKIEKKTIKRGKFDIFPSEQAPIIINWEGQLLLKNIIWGYPSLDKKGLLINARADSVFSKVTFFNGIRNKKAVIPASGFYEWNKNKEKNIFTRPDEKHMYIAGFFDNFNEINRFIILTTEANDSMKMVHHRMPLILEEDQIIKWLEDEDFAKMILKQKPIDLIRETEREQQSFL